ncbi:glycosyltransferase family 2 protein [archaeon]|nr:glycosyltransferase family 2 protein [Nanoarchaeota archaeon]MCG2723879.1 glycosyltransferase family 2 protein [archaeon]
MKQYPKISIIVPAYNAEKTIKQCIESLLIQDYPTYEIIIVDNCSSDKTAEIIKSYGKVKYLYEKSKGSYLSRNTGVNYSTGEILVFTDSDCILKRNWLTRLTEPIRRGKCEASMGGTLSATNGRLENVEQDAYEQYIKTIRKGDNLRTIDTRNFAITGRALEKVGFFDEKIPFAGDYRFGLKLNSMNYAPLFVTGAEVKHFHKSSLKRVFRTKFLQSYWSAHTYITEGFSSRPFRVNYYISLALLLSTLGICVTTIAQINAVAVMLLLLSILLLIMSPSVLKNIFRLNFYAAFYHAMSMAAIRLGILKYYITHYLIRKKI